MTQSVKHVQQGVIVRIETVRQQVQQSVRCLHIHFHTGHDAHPALLKLRAEDVLATDGVMVRQRRPTDSRRGRPVRHLHGPEISVAQRGMAVKICLNEISHGIPWITLLRA